MSRSFGRLADVPIPRPLRRAVLGGFARAMGIDLSEAELPLDRYPSLNHFFVRRLRPGVRAWPDDPRVAASPVDGILGQMGVVTRGRVLQAKGRWYSAAELLADAEGGARYEGGAFLTLYLSPRHYHRIHAPCEGTISSAVHVPGSLLPVNAAAVAHIPDLFARNERLLCYLDGPLGRVAVVRPRVERPAGEDRVGDQPPPRRPLAARLPAAGAGPVRGGDHGLPPRLHRRPPLRAGPHRARRLPAPRRPGPPGGADRAGVRRAVRRP
jgi:phosphatidylserine decarboxylase